MIIAVDTGGTKTLIESFDDQGNKTYIEKFPTPKDKDEYIRAVSETIKNNVDLATLKAIAIAMPGPMKNGMLLRSPNIGWFDFDVVSALQQHFPNILVLLGNDADLGGVGAAHLSKVDGLCVYVTLSTGIGTGVTFDQKLLPELHRFEGGSMRIEYGGEQVRWENVASGKNFYERYGQFGSDVDDPEKWRDYAHRASKGLLLLIPLLEPDAVIIGGSMGTHFHKYGGFLQEILDGSIAKHMATTTLLQSENPEEVVIYGCYYHALNRLAQG